VTIEEYELRYPPRTSLEAGREVTRIAPSPTGRPHIGTALQAVINRALATKTGGLFLVRIEDTDQARLHPGAVDELLAALAWLGVSPDEGPLTGGAYGPYVQSDRLDLYRAAADWLVARGHAYHCFCTPDRLDAVRKAQMAAGVKPMYDRHCRRLPASEVEARRAQGERAVVRMIVPDGESITFHDLARGAITIQSAEVDDTVLLKSDGFPTYHLAAVVDDHFMRITTVVRGEEWISSTPKHVLLYRYFAWTPPRFIHTALLRDPQGRKLSKRSGDTSIAFFASQGIVAPALVNFLTRIIWSHPEGLDVYPYGEFIRLFEDTELSVTGPVADFALLTHINGHYLRQLGPVELYEAVSRLLDERAAAGQGFRDELEASGGADLPPEELAAFRDVFRAHRDMALRILALEPERFRRLTDVPVQCRFYFPDLFQSPQMPLVVRQVGDDRVLARLLSEYGERHEALAASHEAWDGWLRQWAADAGLKPGKVFMALRVAVTGSEKSPPLFEIVRILGPEETRRRLDLVARQLPR
jgi:glutamyl-tRNA synthetase